MIHIFKKIFTANSIFFSKPHVFDQMFRAFITWEFLEFFKSHIVIHRSPDMIHFIFLKVNTFYLKINESYGKPVITKYTHNTFFR